MAALTEAELVARFSEIGVIPVVTLEDASLAPALGRALVAGGLPAAEVTFRTPAAAEAIAALRAACPELLVGAGTVCDVDCAREAVAAGAQFCVSPGVPAEALDWCLEQGVPFVPGVATPTEVMEVRARGVRAMKLFPAQVLGGPALLRSLAGPFGDVRFMCTGGVKSDTVEVYLSQPNVFCVGGTWVAPASLLADHDVATVERLCREAHEAVQRLHGVATAPRHAA